MFIVEYSDYKEANDDLLTEKIEQRSFVNRNTAIQFYNKKKEELIAHAQEIINDENYIDHIIEIENDNSIIEKRCQDPELEEQPLWCIYLINLNKTE